MAADSYSSERWLKLPCVFCGEMFVYLKRGPGRLRKFCSKLCNDAHDSRIEKQKRQSGTPPKFKRLKCEVTCRRCGKVALRAYPDRAKYCSERCHRDAVADERRSRWDKSARICPHCKQTFIPMHPSNYYCSKRCKSILEWDTKNARKRAAFVEPVVTYEVFRRDNWKCQLCGVRTLESKRGTTHPRAPQLDHIVPLSKGGEHSYRNTQCACLRCNLSKNNRMLGQMRMFG